VFVRPIFGPLNSNFIPWLLPNFSGPTGDIWVSVSQNQILLGWNFSCTLCNPCPPIVGSAWRTCARSSTVLPWSGTCERAKATEVKFEFSARRRAKVPRSN
jgi:hypothetical protein